MVDRQIALWHLNQAKILAHERKETQRKIQLLQSHSMKLSSTVKEHEKAAEKINRERFKHLNAQTPQKTTKPRIKPDRVSTKELAEALGIKEEQLLEVLS